MTEQPGCGDPDAFQRLWAPDRLSYVKGDKGSDCPFCAVPALSDEDALVVHRGAVSYVVLNLYPYNPGHVLVCPYRHVADWTELSDDERAEIGSLTAQVMRVVRAVSRPHGFNLGMNQGAVAGAGIAAHLHQHVVPRWGGDANFLPIIARTKALPQVLGDTRTLLAQAWAAQGEPC